jgi:hypothetical protein
VKQPSQSQLRRAAVLQFLVRECLGLHVSTLRDVEQVWGIDRLDIDRLGIASPPSHTFNVIGSGECARKFGDLSNVPGFYRCDGSWFIDVDERLARRGVVLPVRDRQRPNLIVDLQIFRHVRDSRPFLLRVRAERQAA